MVGVLVGVDYRVNQADLFAQQLHPEVGGGVDQQIPPGRPKATLHRPRLFFGFWSRQVRQPQPMTGTPCEVPVPRKIS